jgi:hypothetical protein
VHGKGIWGLLNPTLGRSIQKKKKKTLDFEPNAIIGVSD